LTEINTQNILIIRYGEIALKGMNKPYFEKTLLRRIRAAMAQAVQSDGGVRIAADGGLLIACGPALEDAAAEERLIRQILKVFGVSTVSKAWRIQARELTDIRAAAAAWMEQRLREGCPVTFKVFGKRADKTYPITSPELAADIGEAILEAYPDRVRVDVKNPEVSLYVHLRRKDVLIFDDSLKGFGGLPLGTNGKGLVLLSGGIDSPVAAWLMAKRGMQIEAVHFHSYPYTSKRAEEKVCDLAEILSSYCGTVKVHIVNLLPAQEALAAKCPDSEMTILVRRFMVRIAEKIALREGAGFLITGENLGQVASQTAEGIAVTDRASTLPILRPLIAMDKVDIMALAQEIGTYETSILPYEDCCTVFLPKHPSTKPTLPRIEASESLLGAPEAIEAIEAEVLSSETLFESGRVR
jgi:thiamine biosynthesis protein ThiI